MTPHRFKIDDNIELLSITTDKFKSELITITVNFPITKKNIAYNMLLTSVLKRGTESYPSIASLNRRLDELYSSSLDIKSARLGKNLTLTILADMLDSRYIPDSTDVLGGVLNIMAESLTKPNMSENQFPQKIVEQEKKFLIESLDSIVNNTRSYASTRVAEMMFKNDPEFPTVEELKNTVTSITSKDLTEFFLNIQKSSHLSVFHVGSTSPEALAKKIASRLAPWTVTENAVPTLPYPEPICEFNSVTETMPVSQGKLSMGFKTNVCISDNDDRQYAAILLNEIFGGSASSKLFMNIREKMSLCYYCSSSYDRYTGTMTVSSGIENKNKETVQKAILSELNDIKNKKISSTELDAAKKSLLNGYRQIEDNPYDLQSYYANRAFFGFCEDIELAKSKIISVTVDDISNIAAETVCDSVFFVEGSAGVSEEECYEE